MTSNKTPPPDLELLQKLNLETGKISWPELQRYFARGVLVIVSDGADLVATAKAVSEDDKNYIEELTKNGTLIRAHDEHARRWQQTDPVFWAVVVAPWVLVQEIKE